MTFNARGKNRGVATPVSHRAAGRGPEPGTRATCTGNLARATGCFPGVTMGAMVQAGRSCFVVKKNFVLRHPSTLVTTMKRIAVFIIFACIVLAAGCTTGAPQQGGPSSTPALPASAGPLTEGKPLPMNGNMSHATPNTTFDVSIFEMEIGEVKENGEQELGIYIAARNTGTVPVQLVWFSKLTDNTGKSYGGIGISKGGVGARSYWINPGMAEAARDYVVLNSDRDLEALKKGAILDVYFIERPGEDYPSSLEPEYHTRWRIEPGAIPYQAYSEEEAAAAV